MTIYQSSRAHLKVMMSNFRRLMRHFDYRFLVFIDNPWVVNLLVAGFFTYFLSQTVDQRWWRMIPGEGLAHVPLEESLELLGHVTIGFAAALCKGYKHGSKGLPMPTG